MLDLAVIGDSKTIGYQSNLDQGGFRARLAENIVAKGAYGVVNFTASAINGGTTADLDAATPAFLAANVTTPPWVLVNLGTNDLPGIRAGTLTEAAWLVSMGDILDRVHVKWPAAQVRLMRVYRSDYPTEYALLNDAWIPDVLASRAAFAAVGPDERTFLPGNVSDTTHPTPAGYVLTAAQWQAVIGY